LSSLGIDEQYKVVGIDPGETAGLCLFQGPTLCKATQVKGDVPQQAGILCSFLRETRPCVVVMEDYRVYPWRAKQHTWNSLHTPRLIGAIEYVCYVLNLRLRRQTAQQAKGFCTDEKLRSWGLWVEGQKHARDAIRHVVYHLLFEVSRVQKQAESRGGG
ncbi:MAG: hypothetical protein QXG97_05965, partial [Nitrososphaerota archaeon]